MDAQTFLLVTLAFVSTILAYICWQQSVYITRARKYVHKTHIAIKTFKDIGDEYAALRSTAVFIYQYLTNLQSSKPHDVELAEARKLLLSVITNTRGKQLSYYGGATPPRMH